MARWVAVAAVLVACACPAAHGNLYDDDDPPIIFMDYKNINQTLATSPTPLMVEFYAAWCGHCQNFAPTWRKYAHDIWGWRSFVRVAAINCGDDSNVDICQHFQIRGFPTIKYFPSKSPITNLGETISGRDVDKLRTSTLTRVLKLEHVQSFLAPPSLSQVRYFQNQGMLPPLQAALLFSKDEAHVEILSAVALDYAGSDLLRVWPFAHDTFDPAVANAFGVTEFPAVVIIDRLNGVSVSAGPAVNFTLPALRDRLGSACGKVEEAAAAVAPTPSGPATATALVQMSPPETHVSVRDMESAVVFALHNEVSLPPSLGPQLASTLGHFLELVGRLRLSDGLQETIPCLQTRLHAARKAKEDVHAWPQWLADCKLPTTHEWYQCKGSQPHFRGYTCGLWSLFHTMVMNSPNERAAASALRTMRDYVRDFFGCKVCSGHFLQMAESLEESIAHHRPGDAALWLWRAHNRVNARLGVPGNPSHDPVHPKIQFPSEKQCPKCKFTNSTGGLDWDPRQVLVFLKDFYRVITPTKAAAVVPAAHKQDDVSVGLHHARPTARPRLTPPARDHHQQQPTLESTENSAFSMLSACVALNICSVLLCWKAFQYNRRYKATVASKGTQFV